MKTDLGNFRSPGFAYALAAAFLFGANVPASKLLLKSIDPVLLAGVLYVGAGIGLLAIFFLRSLVGKASSSESPLTLKDAPWLLASTLFGGILAPVFLMKGLSATQAASASMLLNIESVFTAFIAWFIFKEHIVRRIFSGMGFILIGGLVLSYTEHPTIENLTGPLLIVGSCLCWAMDNNVTRKISASDPLQIATIKSLVAGAVNLSLALNLGVSIPGIYVLTAAGAVGFFSFGVSLWFFVLALRSIGTLRTGALFSTAPFAGTALSLVFLHDPASMKLAMAGLLMAVGVYLLLTEKHSHEHAHKAMEHEHRHVHDEHHRHEHRSEDPPGEPHSHRHPHEALFHSHPHYPDIHHRHSH